MRKVDFFIVGAPRCGTTALTLYLSRHPEIFMAPQKEMHHFGSDLAIQSRYRDRKVYDSVFADALSQKKFGEASVFYLYSRKAAEEIHAYNPESKIIIMLRNPVEMIYSLHEQQLKNKHEAIESFAEAIRAEADRKSGKRLPPSSYYPVECFFYTEIGLYAQQVERFTALFPASNIHIILYEDFKKDTAAAYEKTLCFLGVASLPQENLETVNSGAGRTRSKKLQNLIYNPPPFLSAALKLIPPYLKGKGLGEKILFWNRYQTGRKPLDLKFQSTLAELFDKDIRKLEKLIQKDLSGWHENGEILNFSTERNARGVF